MRKAQIIIIILVLIPFILSAYFYNLVPDQVPSHWNAAGEVDDYLPRFWGVFLMPIVAAALVLLFFAIPKLDPLRKNIEGFTNYFDGFIILVILFLLVIHMQVLLWAINIRVSLNITMPIAVGVLFVYMGIMLKHAKRNWFIGIRTPWTLSSDQVWDGTHALAAKLFMAAGVISIAGAAFEKLAMYFVLIPVILTAAVSVVYSYLLFKKAKPAK
ncbi:MAG: SdpI family protein [Nanoarchaeota archaeon]|nr:SdpI family protein [Nanoarchaeota archaeon]